MNMIISFIDKIHANKITQRDVVNIFKQLMFIINIPPGEEIESPHTMRE